MDLSAVAQWLLVAVCGVAGLSCLARAVRSAAARRAGAGGEAVMALGMATMAVPAAVLPPPRWAWAGYAAVFGAAAARALWRMAMGMGRGPGRYAHHLVGSVAMVYMAVPVAAPAAVAGAAHHAGHAGGGLPAVTGALLAYHAVWALRAGTRLVPPEAQPVEAQAVEAQAVDAPRPLALPAAGRGAGHVAVTGGGREADASGVVQACRIVTAVAMVAMLGAG
ncbi:DUF5134 domain-containing protein [Streptomyces sp. DH12]|uniref:DUF5134 domain-containing protein n=1 Tax=Streptomyces sp. DH12 TaxID=2857010 RepID=UPI001E526B4B|nr:DUF5134 domain-containing protein [Streptomyces sp. DH12]